jgi:hypothetical protein
MRKNQGPGSGINIPDPKHWYDGVAKLNRGLAKFNEAYCVAAAGCGVAMWLKQLLNAKSVPGSILGGLRCATGRRITNRSFVR